MEDLGALDKLTNTVVTVASNGRERRAFDLRNDTGYTEHGVSTILFCGYSISELDIDRDFEDARVIKTSTMQDPRGLSRLEISESVREFRGVVRNERDTSTKRLVRSHCQSLRFFAAVYNVATFLRRIPSFVFARVSRLNSAARRIISRIYSFQDNEPPVASLIRSI